MFGKRKGRNKRLTNRKGVPAARKTKGKLKTAAKKSIEESNNLDTGKLKTTLDNYHKEC